MDSTKNNPPAPALLSYEEFKKYAADGLKKVYGSGYEIAVEMSVRTDMPPFETIRVKERAGNVIVNNGYSLQDVYGEYAAGKSLGETMLGLVKDFEDTSEWTRTSDILERVVQADDFAFSKDRHMVRPVRYAPNRKMLEGHVYRRHGDIALVLYVLISERNGARITAKVTKKAADEWNLPHDIVLDAALANTQRLFEPYIIPIECTLVSDLMESVPDGEKFFMREGFALRESPSGMYLLMTEKGIDTATCIFYPGVPERLAEVLGDDLYFTAVQPDWAVVHPKRMCALSRLKGIAADAKARFVKDDSADFLTASVYAYIRRQGELKMV